jgi:hypothetical protein
VFIWSIGPLLTRKMSVNATSASRQFSRFDWYFLFRAFDIGLNRFDTLTNWFQVS